ncbi:MAG: porin [Nitrospirota bacterium]
MKKVLVALVAIGLMAGVAINYAGAEVTVYGRAHLSVDSLDNGTDSSLYLSSNASRLGFKGKQELGMGITGEFQYEVSYNPTGDGVSGARTNFLALSGNFGKLAFGRLDGAMQSHINKKQMFGDQIGDARNFLGGKSRIGRYNNMIQYSLSPTEGFNASLGIVPEEGKENTGGILLGADYTADPLFVGLGYTKWGTNTTGGVDQKTIQVLANYKVSDEFRLMAVYQKTSNLGNMSTAKLAVIGAGVAYSLSPETTIKAQYYKADETASNAKNGATMMAIGADYALSDTTTVYVAYAAGSNEEKATYTPLNWGHGDSPVISAGEDPSGISVGAVHKF